MRPGPNPISPPPARPQDQPSSSPPPSREVHEPAVEILHYPAELLDRLNAAAHTVGRSLQIGLDRRYPLRPEPAPVSCDHRIHLRPLSEQPGKLAPVLHPSPPPPPNPCPPPLPPPPTPA